MIVTKNGRKVARFAALSVMSLSFGLLANHAQAATLWYNANGTGSGFGTSNGGTTSWDGSVWSTTNSATAAGTTWVQGDFPEFLATSAVYTVSVDATESIAGMYNDQTSVTAAPGVTTKISQASGSSGGLSIVSGVQGFLIAETTSAIMLNCPVSGPGGIEQELNGSLYLLGVNSYLGGTILTGGQNTFYNNSSSFSTVGVTVQGGSEQGLLNNASTPVTLPNIFTFNAATPGIILNGGSASGTTPGTTYSGGYVLGTTGTFAFDMSTTATAVTEISGAVSGPSAINVTDKGTLILAGPNTYKGNTTVTAPATLMLGASGTIANTPEVILAGGTLNPDGINQAMSATTLGMTAASTIDYGVGASEIDFANSSALTWTGTLDLMNWTSGVDALRFGIDSTGLTSAELANIEINGDSTTLGTAVLDSNGFVVVPEPASLSLLGLGAMSLLARRRK